jgi:hypothetical protein
VFTGPPRCLGFQENPGSAAPVQLMVCGVCAATILGSFTNLLFAEPVAKTVRRNYAAAIAPMMSIGLPVRLDHHSADLLQQLGGHNGG